MPENVLPNETSIPFTPKAPTEENTFKIPTDLQPYSGLPENYRDQLLSFVMPQLQNQVQNQSRNIDRYAQNAQRGYGQELNRTLKEMIPRQINQLANRGVLDSTVASNTLSQSISQAATASASKGYETAMNAALMKANIPNTLSGLLQYGQSSQDPTVMYRTMAELLANL